MAIDTEYTCSDDGYFSITIPTSSPAQEVKGIVNGNWMMQLATPSSVNSTAPLFVSMFVRKGMKIKFTGSSGVSGTYIPIV